MAELNTQHVTTHTVTLTDFELESLCEAARMALDATDTCVHTNAWQALSRLGKGPLRTARSRTDESLVDTYTNPAIIGRG